LSSRFNSDNFDKIIRFLTIHVTIHKESLPILLVNQSLECIKIFAYTLWLFTNEVITANSWISRSIDKRSLQRCTVIASCSVITSSVQDVYFLQFIFDSLVMNAWRKHGGLTLV
jgi:hypothetical protein